MVDTTANAGAQEVLVLPFNPARLARPRGDSRFALYDSTDRALRRASARDSLASTPESAPRSAVAPVTSATARANERIVIAEIAERAASDAGVESVRTRVDSHGAVLPLPAALWWVARVRSDGTLALPASEVRVSGDGPDTVRVAGCASRDAACGN